MTWFAHTRCDCGAPLTITSDSLTGATIEICAGCGYFGPARPRIDLLAKGMAADTRGSEPSSARLCAEGCGRRAKTPRSLRCRECAAAFRAAQLGAANARRTLRRNGVVVPLLARGTRRAS